MAKRHQSGLESLPRFDSERRGEPDIVGLPHDGRNIPPIVREGEAFSSGAADAAANERGDRSTTWDALDVVESHPAAGDARSAEPAYDPSLFKPQDYRAEIKRVKRKRRIIGLLVFLAVLAIALVVCVAVFKIPGVPLKVDSDAMAQTFAPGQTVFVQDVSHLSDGDVIAYTDADGATQFTRVLAVSGEWVNVGSDGKVVVSDSSLEGTNSSNLMGEGTVVVGSKQVPESTCFVMADSEDNAFDTLYRSENYVSDSQVIGRVAFTL